jgi:hypothetical protein
MSEVLDEVRQRLVEAVKTKQYELAEEWAERHFGHDAERVFVTGQSDAAIRFDCWTCRVTFTVAIQTEIDWHQNADMKIFVIPREGPIARIGPRV